MKLDQIVKLRLNDSIIINNWLFLVQRSKHIFKGQSLKKHVFQHFKFIALILRYVNIRFYSFLREVSILKDDSKFTLCLFTCFFLVNIYLTFIKCLKFFVTLPCIVPLRKHSHYKNLFFLTFHGNIEWCCRLVPSSLPNTLKVKFWLRTNSTTRNFRRRNFPLRNYRPRLQMGINIHTEFRWWQLAHKYFFSCANSLLRHRKVTTLVSY